MTSSNNSTPLVHKRHKNLVFDEVKLRWVLLLKTTKPKSREVCYAKYCKNYRRSFILRGKLYFDKFCSRCVDRRTTANNRLNRLYINLKASAKRRGIPFDLTKGEFLVFCIEHNYHQRDNNNVDSLVVDRIDNTKGYTFSNIQAITHHENSLKRHHEVGPPPTTNDEPTPPQPNDNDDPF